MPAIQVEDTFLFKCVKDPFVPFVSIPTMDLDCQQCGNHWRIPLKEEHVSYKKESEMWRERFTALIGELNNCMQYSEMHYSMNPNKDRFIGMLKELREKILGESEEGEEWKGGKK